MNLPLFLKSLGYFVSIFSVALLAIVGWQSVEGDAFMQACLIGGVATSIVGMGLRWTSFYVRDKREED